MLVRPRHCFCLKSPTLFRTSQVRLASRASTRPAPPPRSPRAIRSYTTHSDLTEEGGFPIGADVEI